MNIVKVIHQTVLLVMKIDHQLQLVLVIMVILTTLIPLFVNYVIINVQIATKE